ncbi:hypothetical protein ACHAXA_000061, partial [Cyclostephanos tholiformis]
SGDDPPSFPSSSSSRPTFDDIDNENFCEAEKFLRENANSTKVLVAMCIGLMDEGGTHPLLDITQHPWTELGKKKNNFMPLNPDLVAEINRHGDDLSRKPCPSQWKNPKLMKWLATNPINDELDIAFLTKEAQTRTKLACHAAAFNRKIMLTLRATKHGRDNDDAKMLYLKRRDIARGHEEVDGRNSVEKQAVTCWEIISDSWNDPGFNPTTEIVPDLHSDYLKEINLSHSCVSACHKATPEYVEKRFQGMIVDLKRGIANWEKSGAGDGGCDDDDCDVSTVDGAGYDEGHELFGSIRGHNQSALSNQHSYFHYCKSYVLYAWHMLEKHGLLRTSFQMLNASISSGDGGSNVPYCVYNDCDDFGNDEYSSRSS